ncbi:MAG TPA: hypothetical protein GX701_08140 [Clostridiales bacterium]|jgi:hypothetical protein|nr:hypothetical protein [Clostridiales bacterium]
MKSRVKSQRLLALPALAIMLLILVGSSLYFKPAENEMPMGAHASWVDHYYSPEEMVEKSDLILTGKVVRSEPELRIDLVITRHYIEIDRLIKGTVEEKELVPVVQTGGSIGIHTTQAFADAPLFQKGESFLLFLKATDEGHYLVMGGYQGAGKIVAGRVRMYDPDDKAGNSFHNLSASRAAKEALGILR